MLFHLFRLLIITLIIVAAFTLPELAPVAQVLTYVIWPAAVLVIVRAVFDRDGVAREQLLLPTPPVSRYRNLLRPIGRAMQCAQVLAIAYSGRPALATAVLFMFFAFAYVAAREKELRAEQAQQDQPAPQVKCPGHR